MSQINAGAFEPKFELVNLNQLVESVINKWRPKAEQKSLALTLRAGKAPVYIRGDEYSLSQAINNPVNNAVVYTVSGGVRVTLQKRKGLLYLTIKDTGIGMSKDFQKQMFKPFTQESTGHTKKYQGLGQGLNLTKRCLDINKIPIRVSSVKNKGTTVRLVFKLAEPKSA